MKHSLPLLCSALLFTSCAGVKIVDTQVASGAANPSNIYIRPFDVSGAEFTGEHPGGPGQLPIRQSLAGLEMANALKVEMEKIAPARVLQPGEKAPEGWLVTGALEVVNGGVKDLRAVFGHTGAGRSQVRMHVRITDAGGAAAATDDKSTGALGRKGNVLYEFDLAGGSRASGHAGSIYAPGLGYSAPFDYKNAAERVMMALSTDPLRTGERTSPTIRY